MDLFAPDPQANLLPADGRVTYHGQIFAPPAAAAHFAALMDRVPWRHDEAVMFGKRIVTARKVAWYGDAEFDYTYSGTTKRALPWSPHLLELKAVADGATGARFNSCLLNLYHDGSEGMGWHSDDEASLADGAPIASLSLGAERRFRLKHKVTGATVSLALEDGSLLVMAGTTQRYWLHQLPKTKRVSQPRINLTFRTMVL